MLAKIKGFLGGLGVGAIVATVVVLWIVGAEGCRFRRTAKLDARPVDLLPTERAIKMESVTFQCPELGPVVILKPSEKQADKIAEDYGVPKETVEGFRILGEHDIPKLEWGGTALSYLDDQGRERIRVKPTPAPLFEIPARWSFYVEGSFMFNEQDGSLNSGPRYSSGVSYDALRFARFHLEPFAEAGYSGAFGSYAEAGVRLSYKTK